MLHLPEAVFFDWDGTLVDSFAFLHAAHNYARTSLGMDEFTIEVFSEYFGQPRDILYQKIYGEHHLKARELFEEFVFSRYKESLKPLPYAQNILQWFQNAGIPCGVVSNKRRALIEAEIKNYGWDDFFVSIVGAGEAEADKPSPAPLALAVQRSGLQIRPDNIWFVGDTANDLGCSNAYGAVSIFLEADDLYHKVSKEFDIDLHKNDCRHFYDFLLQYSEKALKP